MSNWKKYFQLYNLLNSKLLSAGKLHSNGDTFGDNRHFSKAYIPLNTRFGIKYPVCKVNADGIPCCPNDDTLPMKYESSSTRPNGIVRYKFVCPKIKYVYDKSTRKCHRECQCANPCTDSSCGRMIHIYPEKNLRAYPGVLRGTEEWDNTYKIRTTVERDINHMKDNLCLAGRRTQNEKTLHADLILAGITQLISVVLADKIHHHEYIRSKSSIIRTLSIVAHSWDDFPKYVYSICANRAIRV